MQRQVLRIWCDNFYLHFKAETYRKNGLPCTLWYFLFRWQCFAVLIFAIKFMQTSYSGLFPSVVYILKTTINILFLHVYCCHRFRDSSIMKRKKNCKCVLVPLKSGVSFFQNIHNWIKLSLRMFCADRCESKGLHETSDFKFIDEDTQD